jgi:hypothetical protein
MVIFAHCILSRIERKDLKFFPCWANIYWVRARFNSLANKKSTHSEIFLFVRLKILIVSCSLTALV